MLRKDLHSQSNIMTSQRLTVAKLRSVTMKNCKRLEWRLSFNNCFDFVLHNASFLYASSFCSAAGIETAKSRMLSLILLDKASSKIPKAVILDLLPPAMHKLCASHFVTASQTCVSRASQFRPFSPIRLCPSPHSSDHHIALNFRTMVSERGLVPTAIHRG
jgi:hypothetical protein